MLHELLTQSYSRSPHSGSQENSTVALQQRVDSWRQDLSSAEGRATPVLQLKARY